MKKMYIAVLDEFPDFMTPTLVAHAVLRSTLHKKPKNCYLHKTQKIWEMNLRLKVLE